MAKKKSRLDGAVKNEDGTISVDFDVSDVTEEDIVLAYGLDPAKWVVTDWSIDDGTIWVRDDPDAAAVTRQSRRCKAKFAPRRTVEPKTVVGPKWEPVKPASSKVTVKAPKTFNIVKDYKTVLVMPDQQIGYREEASGEELIPIHDEVAMATAIQLAASIGPELIVNVGDMLDLETFSKYLDDPAFTRTTNPSIVRTHQELAMQKEIAPEVVWLKGNHEDRINKHILANCRAAYELKRADATPDDWPVWSIQNLVCLKELGVTYIDQYPDGEHWLDTQTLRFIHGSKYNSAGSTASQYVKEGPFSTIFGHTHQAEIVYTTGKVAGGSARVTFAGSPGTLASRTGLVPGYHASNDSNGRANEVVNNWQAAVILVHYCPGVAYSERAELIIIDEGQALYGGQLYTGTK